MARGRAPLMRSVIGAVRTGFGERADALLVEVDRRLAPGPWSAAIRRGMARPDRTVPLDVVRTEVARALFADDRAQAERRIDGLERFFRESRRTLLDAPGGRGGIEPDAPERSVD